MHSDPEEEMGMCRKIRPKLKNQTDHFTKKPQLQQCNRPAEMNERTGRQTGKCQLRLSEQLTLGSAVSFQTHAFKP